MQTMTIASEQLVIREMTADDLPRAAELSDEQQWPHRREDWDLFLATGEGLVAERGGEVVGTTLAWRYGETAASIGMVIVDPALQGAGIGRRLMDETIRRLGQRTIFLNATEAGLPLYQKLGFAECGGIVQHQGLVREVPLAELPPGDRVRPRGRADGVLAELYSEAYGADRRALFRSLAGESRTVVKSRNTRPIGFAMLRRFGRGWTIGPVVAPDLDSAKALILHWLSVKQGHFCRIDVTADSGLSEWLESLGLPRVGTVRTMARGPVPAAGPAARAFAIAAQAWG